MSQSPNSTQDVLESTGRLLSRQRKWDEAKETLRECVKEFPKSRTCWIDLSTAELQVGSITEQKNAVNQCLAVYPDDPQCLNMKAMLDWQLGLALEGAGRLKDASESFYQACQKNFSQSCQKYDEVRAKL